ncbi:MAG: hypothetical protein R3Y11_11900 [Pseudomonadota bacterium]
MYTMLEDVVLHNDGKADFCFLGRLFSECSWFDAESQTMTRQKLFITEKNEQVYYVMTARQGVRSHRAYGLRLCGDRCTMFDGVAEITMQLPLLMLAVRALCGFDKAGEQVLAHIEETLKAANA